MMHNKKRVVLLLIVLLFIGNVVMPNITLAEKDETDTDDSNEAVVMKTIEIRTVQDLIALQQSCAYDSYSKGLTVLLQNDIDLSQMDFQSIPIFYGVFEGQKHTIKGLNINDKGSLMGLFSTVECGARIEHLNVEGTIVPTGTKSSVGMIAGRNLGFIADCSVKGNVTGDTDIGGVIGVNEASGSVERCLSYVDVIGFLHTGGIVGRNEGSISVCTNHGNVNITEQASKLELSDIDRLAMIANEKNVSAVNDVSDTGGIVGHSEGTITGCTNYGQVGYNHLGYNTGGIVGIQDGIISNCKNAGIIYGRKDIGGIVGQFEPDITLQYGEDTIKTVDEELNGLNSLFRVLSRQLNNSSQDMFDGVNDINGALAIIEGSMKKANDQISDAEAFRMIMDSVRIINESNNKMLASNNDFNTKADTEMANIQGDVDDIRNNLLKLNDTTDSNVVNARDQIGNHVDAIDKECEVINRERKSITDTLNAIQTFTTRISAIMADVSLSIDEKKDQIQDEIKKLQNTDINSVPRSLEKIMGSSDAIISESSSIKSVVDGVVGVNDANWTETAPKIKQSADDIADAATRLKESANAFYGVAVIETAVINKEVNNITTISNQYFNSREEAYDTLVTQLAVINKSVKGMADSGSKNSTSVNKTLNSIINQTEDVQKAVIDMAEVPEYSVVDISDNIEEQQIPGQIASCQNEGAIFGDTNVGGIAGIMAMEVGDDPENDFNLQENLWVDTTAILRAIIMTSDNKAKITVKNGDAGGIVGKCDVGAVYKSTNIGPVEAIGDDKCGGIAGSSKASIIQCYVVCDLVGNNEVGGIAGTGKDIKNCYTMIRINSDGEKLGAIAGATTGEIKDNFFVLESLQGIDRVNYEGKAWPLEYEELIKTEGLPDVFHEFHIDFMIDDELVKRIPITYGASITDKEIPYLPQRDDCYGEWEAFEKQNIKRSAKVNAVYEPWITTLSSGESIPTLLVEGNFSPKAILVTKSWVHSDPVSKKYNIIDGISYSVSDDYKGLPEKSTYRIRCEKDKGDNIALFKDDKITILDASRDGNYLVFRAPAEGKVLILQRKTYLIYIIAIGAFILVGGITAYIIIRKRQKNNR